MKIQEWHLDCAATSPIAAGGNLLTQATVRSIQVLTWPHAQQELIVEPVVERSSARFAEVVRPGAILRYAKPTDVIIRQRFATALLTGWDIRLAINPEQDEYTEPVGRPGQWWPICRQKVIASGAGYTSLVDNWVPTLTGSLRYRWLWSGAPGAGFAIRCSGRCDSAAMDYTKITGAIGAVQRGDWRELEGGWGGAMSWKVGVIAGGQYRLETTQNSGGNLTLSLDVAVEPSPSI